MLGRLLRGWGVAALLVLLATPSALAQATGKVQGRVVDAQTGEPIGGATVRVLGTTRGGITGEDGYYFINEVPAGLQTIVAEFIGRRTFRIENQRILAGQTTTLDFNLEAAAIEIEPLVVEGERNPLVPRDQVSSKAIVTGELIDAVPIDNANAIVLLLPGVIDTNQGRTIRGSRPNEEAVYIDGVITRRYSSGEAEPIELPTNSLAQVDVTTGGMGAQFGEAQSGVVNYVTRSGGTDYSGSLLLMTDAISPKSWRTGFNRLEASFSGPLARNLGFFVSGVLEGQKYQPLNDGFVADRDHDGVNDVPIFVPSGVDQTFRLARSGTAGVDSVDVAFPNFVEWDNGRTLPFNQNDEYTLVGKLSWGLGSAANFDLSYKREREQNLDLGVGELYNPDGFDGTFFTGDVLTLGGYFLLTQSATQALALDVKASYQHYFDQFNELDPEWLRDHRDPFLGFNFSNMKFLNDHNDFEVTEDLVNAVRSGVLPEDELQIYPGNRELFVKNTLPGIEENLRINPYGTQRDFALSGFAGERAGGLEYREESNWWFSANFDWQAGRYLRFLAGGDLGLIDTRRARVPLHTGNAVPALNEPTRAGLFATGRLDIGDVVIDAGLRWDYLKPDGDYPRVPGFVFNVPDSLKLDFVRVLPGEGPTLDRLAPLEDCGGEATAARRTNPGEDGEVGTADDFLVCKENFIAAETKSEISPRLGIAFPVTAKSTFRLSYSHSIQVPGFHQQGFGGLGAASGMAGLFADQYADLQGGLANTNTLFGRDVDLPRTVLFEAGYRQLIGEDLVVDVAVYAKTRRNGLTFRKLPFEDPTNPGSIQFLNVLTNADYEQTRGVDLRVDKRFGEIANFSGSYSFVDARGTGSDPYTYEGLILRRNTNLSIITGEPVVPPDVVLPLEQSRRHNLAGTLGLLFPVDYQQGTPVGSVLSDLGVFVIFRLASGLPYTRLFNSANGQTGPPTDAGLGGIPAEELNASALPWERRLDLALTKGVRFGGLRARMFADWRNPLNLLNTNEVYLETGTTVNELFKETVVNERLRDDRLDGDPFIDDFDIAGESIENPLNVYSLLQAEKRFGNGDGFFTVEEQKKAFGAAFDLFNGKQWLEESNQSLRLGIEFLF